MNGRRLLRTAAAATAGLVVAGFLALQLPQSPVRSVVVAGPSMQPSLHGGDVVVTVRRESYRPGQVVAFRIRDGEPGAGKLVIHRIAAGDGRTGFVMRGDNRASVDPWHPRDADVVGEAALVVPKLGLLPSLLHTPLGMAALAALVTVFSIGLGRRAEPAAD